MKIVYFSNTGWYLYNFRLSLLEQVREKGAEVLLISPEGPYVSHLQDEGFRWQSCPMDRKSLNPLKGARSVLHLTRLLRREQPDIIHNFTLKSIVYGSIAARLAGVQGQVNAIAGLGHYFSDTTGLDSIAAWGIRQLLRFSLSGTQVIFQNPDDRDVVVRHGLAPQENSHLIRSSGVDTGKFRFREEPEKPVTVLLASRMLWSKGIRAFVNAGRRLVEEGVDARFVIVGAPDDGNPDAISEEQLRSWDGKPGIEWWGFREDMPSVIAQSHIVCLPTQYGEGVPKILTEAAASGRPLVATEVAGCREIVKDGENGILVPPKNLDALVEALRSLIDAPKTRSRMGARSREIAVREFSDAQVIEDTLSLYEQA